MANVATDGRFRGNQQAADMDITSKILTQIDELNDAQREALFEDIMHKYCIYCGGPNPQFSACNCENDE